MRSTCSVEQPIELLSRLTYQSIHPINLLLVALLELTLHHPLSLHWQRHIHVSNQHTGERPPLQRPGVLVIVTYVSKERIPMRSTGSVEQPIELLSALTYQSIYPINLSLVATLELTLQYNGPCSAASGEGLFLEYFELAFISDCTVSHFKFVRKD